jgi:hypothetical protein
MERNKTDLNYNISITNIYVTLRYVTLHLLKDQLPCLEKEIRGKYKMYETLDSHHITTTVYPKVSGLSHNEIYAYSWHYSLLYPSKSYGGKTH